MNLRQNIEDIGVIFQQASTLHMAGRLREAADIYQRLLQLQPTNPRVLNNLGNVLIKLGDSSAGMHLLQRSLAIEPDQPAALFNVATILANDNRVDEALVAFGRVISFNPMDGAAHLQRALLLHRLGRHEEALAGYDRAISVNPRDALAHYNRALLFQEQLRLEAAVDGYTNAIAVNPKLAGAYANRANVHQQLKEVDLALADYDCAIALEPGRVETYANRGLLMQDMKRYDEAMVYFDRAIAVNPEFPPAYINKALLLLLLGDYEQGWRIYEWRWKGPLRGAANKYRQPMWLGEHSLKGKTLLIPAEQGLGDVIQFCRYVPSLEAQGASVVLEVQPALVSLFRTLHHGSLTVIPIGAAIPDYDYYCPIMSLPLAFHTTLSTIPSGIPYLAADAGKRSTWQHRLGKMGKGKKARIGLVWCGSIGRMVDQNPFRKRRIALDQLDPLLQLPFEFHSLQKEIRDDDAEILKRYPQIASYQDELKDFSDTAALVAEMDMVITIDTSVAHLAGAMGKPTWVLLPTNADYRWTAEDNRTPWYPTARLFRQTSLDDWPSVIAGVVDALNQKALDVSVVSGRA